MVGPCPAPRPPDLPGPATAAPSAAGPVPSGWDSAASAAPGGPWRSSAPGPHRAASGPPHWPVPPPRPPRPCPLARSVPRRPGPALPGSVSSTGSWGAGSCLAPSSSWPGSPGWASPRSCSTSPRRRPPCPAHAGTARSSTSPGRSRHPRCGCAPSGSTPWTRLSSWPPRPPWRRSWDTWRRPPPPWSWWTPSRPSPRPRSRAAPGASPRCGPWRGPLSPWPRNGGSPCSWWGT